MIGFHRRFEGEVCHPGVNYNFYRDGEIQLIIIIWKLGIYFRRRGDRIMEQGNKKRYLFGLDWRRPYVVGGINSDFDTRSLSFNGKRVCIEQIQDYIERVGDKQ